MTQMPIENPVTELTEDQCWNMLTLAEVGRLATAVGGMPEIYPVNFVVDGESIVFRTAEGTKLAELTANTHVAFEVDAWNEEFGKSVLIKGHADVITDPAEHARAERLPLLPWVPTTKVNYVRVTADEVTGRRFAFGEEPRTH